MKNVIVVGAQWGDEGKGKVTDILTPRFDIVARYQGGHNAGHTVKIGDQTYILHLIPSGILHGECTCVLGNGMVIDPRAFNAEVIALQQMGVSCEERLFISNRAHLIGPWHQALEAARERTAGSHAIGTTMRGIGLAYEDKTARIGLRVGDLLYPELFNAKLQRNVAVANSLLFSMREECTQLERVQNEYVPEAHRLVRFIRDTALMLNRAIEGGDTVLLEGGQGTMLDVDHGTYPYVTSSNSTAGGACTGTGISPRHIGGIIGVAKAYTTRVGNGPFPTELFDETGKYLQREGKEVGASTGRTRRTGWFDAMVVRYSAMLNGCDALALMKLDVLDGLDEIKVCTAYHLEHGPFHEGMPASAEILSQCKPAEYMTIQGWRSKTSDIRCFDELPRAAKAYIRLIEEVCRLPVALVSVGPDRDQTIIRNGSLIANLMA